MLYLGKEWEVCWYDNSDLRVKIDYSGLADIDSKTKIKRIIR